MEFYNFVMFIELLVLFAINGPMYYKIPHNFNQSDLFLDIRNRQGLSVLSVLCYRAIDVVLLKAGDTTRINSGTCMHVELLTLVLISWILWLELVLFVSAGSPNSVKHIKLQILCFICPFLMMAPCMFYKMFEYTPTTYRVICSFKTPTVAETHQIGISSMMMLLFTLWIPAHTLLIMSYKRNRLNMLTVVMGLVCIALYIPELMHFMDNNTKASIDASTCRSFILMLLSVYLNSSVAAKMEKEVV
ncbi:uncharacterized protein LOC134822716 [Bolinopsis microptera]|uniref:uncharacterized protein LOC134822716 n=1 Tax=Bolinopsis microptera TaxID=2820187 RepID=UPI0030797EF6